MFTILRRRSVVVSASQLIISTPPHRQHKYNNINKLLQSTIRCKSVDKNHHPLGDKVKNAANDGKKDKIVVPEPSKRELYIVGLHQAIPFVGFGIMDNAILILAGEAIDIYLGVALGISTMCAAAIGNIISDLCGVVFGTMIEDALLGWSKKIERITRGRVKLPPMPDLTYEQRNLRSVRWSGQMGCAAGLTIGCIIGMVPLLFFPSPKEKKIGDDSASSESSNNKQVIDRQNVQLSKEIAEWKGKHAEVVKRMKILEKEKQDQIWDRGY